jgi:hypothetical protein
LNGSDRPFRLKLDAHEHVSSMTWVKRAPISADRPKVAIPAFDRQYCEATAQISRFYEQRCPQERPNRQLATTSADFAFTLGKKPGTRWHSP